ncbi:hypothetical protein TNCV_646671 [Trichonephila clavipes]|nr:hypothetical protein TNCV_646671 [Trichonephila clavipes]
MKLLICFDENESGGGELSCYNLDSDENIRLRESYCEVSEESADVTDNIPVNLDIYVARDGTGWILYNCNVFGRFVTPNVLRQSSGPTSFGKHNGNVGLDTKDTSSLPGPLGHHGHIHDSKTNADV